MKSLLFVSLLFIGCGQIAKKDLNNSNTVVSKLSFNQTYDSLFLDTLTLIAIDSFVRNSNCKDCIFEMFVDKVLPNRWLITLKSRVGNSEYVSKMNPLFSIRLSDEEFYIYSGLEDIFKSTKKNLPTSYDYLGNTFKMWTLDIIKDSTKINIDLIDIGYDPFFSPIEFNARKRNNNPSYTWK